MPVRCRMQVYRGAEINDMHPSTPTDSLARVTPDMVMRVDSIGKDREVQ